MSVYKFPDNFKWGSATSAHQVEGGNHNDWTEWETSKLRVESLRLKGLDPVNFISGKACDSYNRYEEDFDIAKKLNQNIHRFSIEWSRIEPEEGRFNDKEMQHYVNVVKALRDRGMEPMITLWHFTNPAWFAKKGGFINIDSPKYYVRYVKYVVKHLPDVRLWITFNEATTVYTGYSYLKGLWPPEYKSILKWRRTNRNIVRAHILAYKEIKSSYNSPVDPNNKENGIRVSVQSSEVMSHNVEVGVAESNVYVPETKNFFKSWLRRQYKQLRNYYFFKKALPHYDFIGLNYYHMDRKPHFNAKNELIPRQSVNKDMGWELYPEGIYHVLRDLDKFKKPVFITENGIADSEDQYRLKFIRDHLLWLYKAIQDGSNVRGYLYWSLLDNFEWAHGYTPRFGLIEVDFKTLERNIRPSAWEYAKICRDNAMQINE